MSTGASEAGAALEVERIDVRYDCQQVLEALSLRLDRGDIGCLLGPSGCGKTTVLRAVIGFQRVCAGTIRLAGRTVSSEREHTPPEARGIGMVFQDYALFPHLTVAGNIGFGMQGASAELRARRAAELLELVGLPELANRYPHQLSGGQQQRVALARALAPRPQLLLLDEPFSNLDVALREKLAQEVRGILEQTGTTAVLVTHDQDEAFAVADVVGVMSEGAIRQWATPYELYHQPVDRFVARFVGEGVLLPGRRLDAHQVQTEIGVIHSPDSGGAGARPGAVDVLIRPDDIQHDDTSAMRARVVSRAFRGAQFLYTLELPSGRRMLSLVPSHHNHAIGEHIGIRLEVDHLVAFDSG